MSKERDIAIMLNVLTTDFLMQDTDLDVLKMQVKYANDVLNPVDNSGVLDGVSCLVEAKKMVYHSLISKSADDMNEQEACLAFELSRDKDIQEVLSKAK